MKNIEWVYIKLNHDKRAKIDKEDLERVMKHKWRVILRKSGKYVAVTSLKTNTGQKQVTLGKFIMKPSKGKFVYPRRSSQELDYRKGNLIVCTMSERQIMLPKRKSASSSMYKGVSWDKNRKMWRSTIEVNGKSLSLGVFKYETDAALTYNEAARKHYGDMAYQNQVRKRNEKRLAS